MTKLLSLVLLLLCPVSGMAQAGGDVMDAMAPVRALLGEWEGEGWIDRGPGQRHHFVQTERIEALLGGEVILIQGQGRAAEDTSRVVHDALAFIGYDVAAERYVMRSFLPGGRTTQAEVDVDGGAVTWRIGSEVRYTIRVDENGEWHETGEYSRDGGDSWSQFFEMTLRRIG